MPPKRGKTNHTKTEILLFLSDGVPRKSREIKDFVLKELKYKQASRINKHLRDLEASRLITSDGAEKGIIFDRRGSRMELTYCIYTEQLQACRVFLFLNEATDEQRARKYMLSTVYSSAVKSLLGDLSHQLPSQLDLTSKRGASQHAVSVQRNTVPNPEIRLLSLLQESIEYGIFESLLQNTLLTSPDVARSVLGDLISFHDNFDCFGELSKSFFQRLQNFNGSPSNAVPSNPNVTELFHLLLRSLELYTTLNLPLIDTFLLLIVKKGLERINHTNLVMPAGMYFSFLNGKGYEI